MTILLILAAVPIARFLRKTLTEKFGNDVLAIILLPFIVAGLEVFRRFVWNSRREERLRKSLLFLLICGIYVLKLYSLKIQVERFHLLEYGVLAIFVTLACNRHKLGKISLGWALVVVHITALTDELFQWYWPDRYGEWRDVVINFESAVMALIAVVILNPPIGLFNSSSRKAWSILLLVFSVLSIISGMFFLKVQVFGYEHFTPETGRFRSIFKENQLLMTTEENYRGFLDSIGKNTGQSAGFEYTKYWYEREAREHFDRTRLLWEQKKIKEAALEYRITNLYYSAYLKVRNLQFSEEIDRSLSIMTERSDPEHLSSVLNWFIVGVNREQVIWIQWFFACIFAFCAFVVIFWRH